MSYRRITLQTIFIELFQIIRDPIVFKREPVLIPAGDSHKTFYTFNSNACYKYVYSIRLDCCFQAILECLFDLISGSKKNIISFLISRQVLYNKYYRVLGEKPE